MFAKDLTYLHKNMHTSIKITNLGWYNICVFLEYKFTFGAV